VLARREAGGLAGVAGDEAEAGFGGDGVDDVGDGGALVVGELAEVGELRVPLFTR